MRPSRRVIALLVLLPLVVALAVVASAWEAGPTPDDLQARVASRAKQSGARAIPLARIAPAFLDAVVATEDERFYRHQGVDVVGVLRAVPYDVAHLSFAQGASTIPEQLAKLLYLDGNDHSLWRKVRAAVIAYRLERANTKAQLLDAYSNSVHLGAGAYGVERASRVYFGRTARGLTLAQASLLAGLIQAPSALDPFVAPEAARRRQRHVLQAMVRNGYASPAEAAAVLASPLELRNGPVLGPVIGVVFRPPSGGPSLTLLAIVCVLAALAVTTVVSGVALIAVLLDRPLTSRTLITGGTLLLAVTLAAVAEESVGFV